MTFTPRTLFVTTALPYANGTFHIGHIMEYIQADIWVRYQRMQGHEVFFVGADDAHGAPIMIAAEKKGVTPEAFVAEIATGRQQYLAGLASVTTTGTAPTATKTSSWRKAFTPHSKPTA